MRGFGSDLCGEYDGEFVDGGGRIGVGEGWTEESKKPGSLPQQPHVRLHPRLQAHVPHLHRQLQPTLPSQLTPQPFRQRHGGMLSGEYGLVDLRDTSGADEGWLEVEPLGVVVAQSGAEDAIGGGEAMDGGGGVETTEEVAEVVAEQIPPRTQPLAEFDEGGSGVEDGGEEEAVIGAVRRRRPAAEREEAEKKDGDEDEQEERRSHHHANCEHNTRHHSQPRRRRRLQLRSRHHRTRLAMPNSAMWRCAGEMKKGGE